MKITLNSGREITLARLEQWRTYAGVLAGMPNREMNGRVIEDARSRALQHGLQGASPLGDGAWGRLSPRLLLRSHSRFSKRFPYGFQNLAKIGTQPAIDTLPESQACDQYRVRFGVWIAFALAGNSHCNVDCRVSFGDE